MSHGSESKTDPDEDCPLPVSMQNRNIACFATFWAVYYLVAPVSYIGSTHANMLEKLGNSDDINNLPSAMYLWLTFVPVVVTWLFPHPRSLKWLATGAISVMTMITGTVALTLGGGASAEISTLVVIAHGALFGAANGLLIAALWDFLRRGVSTSRRGKALGYAFGLGPLFACVGSLFQDACLTGRLLGGRTFGLEFPQNYVAMFAAAAPLLFLAGLILSRFVVPDSVDADEASTDRLAEIRRGLSQFVRDRTVFCAVVIYVLVYSGGNAILSNISLLAENVFGANSDTVGQQSFLRFSFKAAAGGLLGILLAKVNPRATLLATTSILLFGLAWMLSTTGNERLFLVTFGILGAGELFGAHFPNYVTTASNRRYVRINMAYLGVLNAFTGFAAYGFGVISQHYGALYGQMQGRIISVYFAAAILVLSVGLILVLLPANPSPRGVSDVH
ncbi:MAG: hypothetical protein U0872_16675 [Planctomycetaceae bacterium]